MACPGVILPAVVVFVHTCACLHHTHGASYQRPHGDLATLTNTGELGGDENPKHPRP